MAKSPHFAAPRSFSRRAAPLQLYSVLQGNPL